MLLSCEIKSQNYQYRNTYHTYKHTHTFVTECYYACPSSESGTSAWSSWRLMLSPPCLKLFCGSHSRQPSAWTAPRPSKSCLTLMIKLYTVLVIFCSCFPGFFTHKVLGTLAWAPVVHWASLSRSTQPRNASLLLPSQNLSSIPVPTVHRPWWTECLTFKLLCSFFCFPSSDT